MDKTEARILANMCARVPARRIPEGRRGYDERHMKLMTEGSDRDLQEARIEMELTERLRRKRP